MEVTEAVLGHISGSRAGIVGIYQRHDWAAEKADGVTEAASPNGEEFGPTRLYEVVSRNVDASAAGIRDRIESALTKFSQGTQAADDITLVIVKRQAETRALTMSGIR